MTSLIGNKSTALLISFVLNLRDRTIISELSNCSSVGESNRRHIYIHIALNHKQKLRFDSERRYMDHLQFTDHADLSLLLLYSNIFTFLDHKRGFFFSPKGRYPLPLS